MSRLNRHIRNLVVVLGCIFIVLRVLPNLPFVQRATARLLVSAVEEKSGAHASLSGLRWRLPTDLLVDTLQLEDLQGDTLLTVDRMALKVKWMSLLRDERFELRNVRLYHPVARLSADSVGAPSNARFLLDAFASQDTARKSIPCMRINSLIVRDAALHYDVMSEPETPGVFNIRHVGVTDFNAHLSLKALSADTLSVILRELNGCEQSGICMDDVRFRLTANRSDALLTAFALELPHTTLHLDTLHASYVLPPVGEMARNGNTLTGNNFMRSLCYDGVLANSVLTPSSLAPLIPRLRPYSDKLTMSARFSGDTHSVECMPLELRSSHRDIDILVNGRTDLHDRRRPLINGDLQRLTVTEGGWRMASGLLAVADNLSGSKLSPLVQEVGHRIGSSALHGTFDLSSLEARADITFVTDAGSGVVKVDVNDQGCFTASVDGDTLHLGRLLAEPTLGTTSTAVAATGLFDMPHRTLRRVDGKGQLNGFQYHGYTYRSITVAGILADDTLKASVAVNDPHAKLLADGICTMSAKRKQMLFLKADVDSLDLHALHLTKTHEDTRFAFTASCNLTGTSIDDLSGSVSLNHFTLTDSLHTWMLNHLALTAVPESYRRSYSVFSDIMNGSVTGNFRLTTLLGSAYNVLGRYEPALVTKLLTKASPDVRTATRTAARHAADGDANEMSFYFNVSDLAVLDELLGIPVGLHYPATFKGSLSDKNNQPNVDIALDVQQLYYGDNHYRDLLVKIGNAGDTLRLTAEATSLSDGGSQLQAHTTLAGKHDDCGIQLTWNDTGNQPLSGHLSAHADIRTDDAGDLLTWVNVQPSEALLGGGTWRMEPCLCSFSPARFTLSDLHLSNGPQLITADGSVATREGIRKGETDSLAVRLDHVNLDNLMTLMPSLKILSFGGTATGTASLCQLFSTSPRVTASLGIDALSFCRGPLGDATAEVGYNSDGIVFDVQATETTVKGDSLPQTRVSGTASVADKAMDLTVQADGTRLSFLNGLLGSIMTEVDGRAYGSLRIHGPFDALDMEGNLHASQASFRLPSTNVTYRFDDVVRFTPGLIRFDNYTIFDRYGNSALFYGNVSHDHFANWAYDIVVDAHGILGLDFPNTGNDLFYTTLFADGTVRVQGSDYVPLRVDVDARTCPNSIFAFNLSGSSDSKAAFITYRDQEQVAQIEEDRRRRLNNLSTRRRNGLPPTRRQRRRDGELVEPEYEINVHASVSPDATIKLVMDQTTDDHVSAYGSGNIDIQLKNGNLTMDGPFILSYGSYHLNVQNLVHKDFEVVSGSTVTFDGDPMEARLDITAQHMVPSVSMADLTADAASMDNVRVNCLLGIKGTPNNPQLQFGLELPQGTEEQKSILKSYTATEEQMDLQFVYLLGLGKFYTYDYGQMTGGTQGGYSTMTSLLNSTISGQINSIISNMLPNNNWSLSGNIRSDNILGNYADEELAGNMEVQGVLEGRLLNNRLLVNGNFGYRDNPMHASNFIGDFDIRYLLAARYNLWLKGYNKTNDRYFSKTSLTTQGIGLMFSRDFDALFKKSTPAVIVPDNADSSDNVAPSDTIP